MQRLALVIAFVIGTINYAFAQAPAADPHHPAQDAAPASQSSGVQSDGKPQSRQGSGAPQMRSMMQGMMGMMQGMQGMMSMMHQQAQSEQRQPARMQAMQDCPMMMPRTTGTTEEISRSSGATSDETTMRAMMQMMQGMMQMMQSQMQSQGQRGPQ